MEHHILFVCLMGMGTVFFGLICLIALTTLLGRIAGQTKTESASSSPVSVPAEESEVNRPELIAAISAAIAEDLGTDITGIRILSIRKL